MILNHIVAKHVEYFMKNDTIDQSLFQESPGFILLGVIIPILSAIGIITNTLTWIIYCHKDLRSNNTLILKANLATDSIYLLTASLVLSPKEWLNQLYQQGDYDLFWSTLTNIQATYTVCFPICQIMQVVSIMYSMLLILEQCAVFYIPEKLSKWLENNASVKLIITLLNVVVLSYLITFFKFEKREIYVIQSMKEGNRTKYYLMNRLCLSVIYNSENYQRLEKYIYFSIFEGLTWLVTFVAFFKCLTLYIKNKYDLNDIHILHSKWLRLFRSGRSLRMNLVLAATFLCLKALSIGMYLLTLPDMKFGLYGSNCHLTPMDTRFLQASRDAGRLYLFSNILVACVKPWVCAITSYDMKNVLSGCWSKKTTQISHVARRVCVIMDPFRPRPQPGPPSTSLGNNYQYETQV